MQCPKCGAENDDSRASCRSCYSALKSGDGKPIPPQQQAQPAGQAQARPRETPGPVMQSRQSSGGSKFPVAIPVVIVVVGLVVAWWFLLFNPSPVPAAKAYAVSKTSEAGSSNAKAEVTQSGAAKITGDKAEVPFTLKISMPQGNPFGMKIPDLNIRVALVKSGSVVRKQWTVDEELTNQLAMQDIQAQMGSMLKGMMKGLPAGSGKMPAMPGMR